MEMYVWEGLTSNRLHRINFRYYVGISKYHITCSYFSSHGIGSYYIHKYIHGYISICTYLCIFVRPEEEILGKIILAWDHIGVL